MAMGLDWQPLGKPKPGHEAEFEELFTALFIDQVRDRVKRDRLSAIEISPYETLGIPRVGFDPAADRWAAERYSKRSWKKLFVSRQEFMRACHGSYVMELLPLPPPDGVPHYTNGGADSYCEVFTFRGKFLEFCEDVLGQELLAEAWASHSAADLMEYGTKLRDRAVAYAEKEGVSGILPLRDPPDGLDVEEPAGQAHIVISAARWCAFWSEGGHGMIADF